MNRSSFQDAASTSGSTRLKNVDKIGKVIPGGWQEGRDYAKGQAISVGDLVVVPRSDGTVSWEGRNKS